MDSSPCQLEGMQPGQVILMPDADANPSVQYIFQTWKGILLPFTNTTLLSSDNVSKVIHFLLQLLLPAYV